MLIIVLQWTKVLGKDPALGLLYNIVGKDNMLDYALWRLIILMKVTSH